MKKRQSVRREGRFRRRSRNTRSRRGLAAARERLTAFHAAQTAAAAVLFHQNRNASSEEEEEGSLQPNTTTAAGKRANAPQMLMGWTQSNPAAGGSNESEKEKEQIIRSSSASSVVGGGSATGQPPVNGEQLVRISPQFEGILGRRRQILPAIFSGQRLRRKLESAATNNDGHDGHESTRTADGRR